jgi:uncharacterized protein YjbI with pentapeptide repeats
MFMSADFNVFSWAFIGPVLFLVVCFALLYWLPKLQTRKVRSQTEPKGPYELENDYRQTLVQIFGGIAIVATVYGAVENARLAREANQQAIRTYELTRQGQVADRTFKAMDMLSKKDNMDSRVAAIYALEQVANEVPASEWQITETLFNYARIHSHWSASSSKNVTESLPADIAAITDYLARRPYETRESCLELHQCWDYETRRQPSVHDIQGYYRKVINLPEADLRHAFLEGAMLKTANLQQSHLERAWLRHAHVENAYAKEVHLENADLSDSSWIFANLTRAQLKSAQLCRAHFEHAYAGNSNLEDADLENSYWNNALQLRRSSLEGANLNCSVWRGADMDQLNLDGASLYGADLTGAINLTKSQLEKAFGDNSTKLRDEKLRPSNWKATSHLRCPKKAQFSPCPKL